MKWSALTVRHGGERLIVVGWRILGIGLLLTEPVWAARIVVTCYDGAPSASVGWGTERPIVRFSGCDLDRAQNGTCQFRVSIGARSTVVPRLFDGTVAVGGRQRLRYRGTRAVVRCHAGPEPNPVPCEPSLPRDALTYTCQGGVLVEPTPDPVCRDLACDPACDFDRSCDDSCTFSFRCPPNCGLGPCFEQPMYAVRVPVGCRGVLPECARGAQPALALECRPPPSGFACPPTTTTLPPSGSCRADADCSIFPLECQHCELGFCEGFPTFNPNRSVSNVVCPIPP